MYFDVDFNLSISVVESSPFTSNFHEPLSLPSKTVPETMRMSSLLTQIQVYILPVYHFVVNVSA